MSTPIVAPTAAGRETPRLINRYLILNLVRKLQPISRVDLTRRLGLAGGLVTHIVGELLAEGLLIEKGIAASTRGRPPRFLLLNSRGRLVVAIDLRVTQTGLMLVGLGGREIALEAFATAPTPERWARDVVRRVRRLLAVHGRQARIDGVGLAVPGITDPATGRLVYSPTLGWRDVDIAALIRRQTGLPTSVENAPRAVALAHLWYARDEDAPRTFFSVSIADGVGGALVTDGQVLCGRDNLAGSVGHVSLAPDGPLCHCGARGCLEAYASNVATLARYFGTPPFTRGRRASRPRGPRFTVSDVVARARGGDARAFAALNETARHLGAGLRAVVTLTNPEVFVLDGEITAAWDLIGPTVRSALTPHALTRSAGETPIRLSTVPHPRLLGAAALVAAPAFSAPEVV